MNTEFRNTITNNFNNDIIYTTTRGKDLDIDLDVGIILICTKTNQRVAFHPSSNKLFDDNIEE